MKAVVMRRGELVLDEVPAPVPGEGEVLLRTLACGICGSDLHALQRAARAEADGAEQTDPVVGATGSDVVMGHEFCAEVVDFGPGTEGTLAPGTRVVSVPSGVGYSDERPGGYGEFMILPEARLLRVPDHLATEHAAMTEPLAVGEHAVARALIEAGDVPLVIGCGPVGLAVIAALRARRLSPIVAADFSPKRRELAAGIGADVVVDPNEQPAFESWREAADSPVSADGLDERSALVFECVGVPGMIQSIIDDAPRNSRVVVAGVCMQDDVIRPLAAIRTQINLQFVLGYTPEEFEATLDALATERIDAGPLVTAHIGLDDVPDAFRTLTDPSEHAKIMIVADRD
ncbi:MAG: zinc-binding dehydrogenase [Dehalococcoidia bacterium]|jgi:threonine dehydrogenase-like Zn-dependent dehydrogenase|nr:zinc-binding dehydrogenase [Dehalococcoidia bacterium]